MIVNVLVLFRFPSIFRALMILSFIFSYQEILSSQKLYMELGMGVNVSAIPKDGSTKLDLTATNVKIPFPSLRFRFIYNRSGFTVGMMQLPSYPYLNMVWYHTKFINLRKWTSIQICVFLDISVTMC